MRFLWAHFSSLSSSLWMASCPSVVSSVPHSFVPSAVLLRLPSVPLSVSSVKMLNTTDPRVEPWGTSLVTSLYLDTEPLTTTLAAFIQPVPYLPKSSQFKSMCLLFGDEGVMWNCVESFTEVYVNDTCQSPPISHCCHCTEGH